VSAKPKLFASVSNYSLGNLLFSMAGLVSFPLLTRLLSVEDYGLLALVGSTITLIVAFAKAGLQHATLRFYSDCHHAGGAWSIDNYYATVLYGMGAIGLLVTLGWLGISQWIPQEFWNNDQVAFLFAITAVLVWIKTLDSSLINILRAKEYTGVYNSYVVLKRYGSLALILFTLFFISQNLTGFFIATLLVEFLAVWFLAVYLFAHQWPQRSQFSLSLFKTMLLFGIPMIGYELAGIILNIGDRYMIQWYMGASQLGPYAAAYNLTEMVHGIVVVAFSQAVMPMYLRIWSEQGHAATVKFIEQSLYYYLIISLPIVAGLSAVGGDLLMILASDKYNGGALIIPYVIAGLVIDGAIALLGAGLYIHKNSAYLMKWVVVSAVINIGLNMILIPDYGLQGAAIATLISYALLASSIFIVANRKIKIRLPGWQAAKIASIAYAMYFVVIQIHTSHFIITLALQILTGALFYSLVLLAIDRQARQLVRDVWLNFQQ